MQIAASRSAWVTLRVACVVNALLAVMVASRAVAQTRFEVAAIRRNLSGEIAFRLEAQPGGRMVATNVPARELVLVAYGLQPFQVVDGPRWMDVDRFDVTAHGSPDAPPEATREMMRNLLAERFQLVAHEEEREMPTYALVRVGQDGAVGPQLQKSSSD